MENNDITQFEFISKDCKRSPEERSKRLKTGGQLKLRSLDETAHLYDPSEDLLIAMNTAVALEKPLLILGEPGTGKTQAAYYLKHYFGCEKLHKLSVRSTSRFEDLFYNFDTVRYYRDAQLAKPDDTPKPRAEYIDPGPLWRAMQKPSPQVLLIDEIDKAPRDFPNDLLNAIDQFEFKVPELFGCTEAELPEKLLGATQEAKSQEWQVQKPKSDIGACQRAPIVVITSNNVEQLPEPFLRRCVFHYIELTPQHLKRIAKRHLEALKIQESLLDTLINRFYAVRDKAPQKLPSTAEFLEWAYIIGKDPKAIKMLIDDTKIPYKYLLLKIQEDIETIFP